MSKIFYVNLLDGYYYETDEIGTDNENERYVYSKKEAIKLLNENNWFECKGCNLFFTDKSLDKKEHYCKLLEILN